MSKSDSSDVVGDAATLNQDVQTGRTRCTGLPGPDAGEADGRPGSTPRRRHVRRAVLPCPGRARPGAVPAAPRRARLHGARRRAADLSSSARSSRDLRVLSEPVGDKHAAQSS